jgi:hypothetical protein
MSQRARTIAKFIRRCVSAVPGKGLRDVLIPDVSVGHIALCREQHDARELLGRSAMRLCAM